MSYYIRYRPGTELARRFPQPEGTKVKAPFSTREDAERIRARCANAADMEVYETSAVES